MYLRGIFNDEFYTRYGSCHEYGNLLINNASHKIDNNIMVVRDEVAETVF